MAFINAIYGHNLLKNLMATTTKITTTTTIRQVMNYWNPNMNACTHGIKARGF